ncbi:MAG TPA: MerR family transcriptional regulator [Opitutaceae bacterium]|nr:MerR family transcriptional regulator [Opitutaceae bacterium]
MPFDPQLFSIGEFSQISGLSVKTLRFYDEKGLLKPAQVDAASGYRFYDGASAERARIVAQLRGLQFPLDEIARILAECDDEADLLGHLERQRRLIEDRLRADRRTARALATMIAHEREAAQLAACPAFAVEEKQLAPLLVAGLRMTGRYADCGRGFATLGRALGRHCAGKPLCLYHDGEYREEDANFEPCLPLRQAVTAPDGVVIRTLPASRCLSLVHQGPYPQLGRSYRRIFAELKRRGLTVERPTREVYLKGPGMIFRGNPRRYLTEIQLPVSPA